MAEKEGDEVQTLKDRGLTCAKLKSVEQRELKESGEFRRIGFLRIAEAQEQSAKKIRELRQKVCRLR